MYKVCPGVIDKRGKQVLAFGCVCPWADFISTVVENDVCEVITLFRDSSAQEEVSKLSHREEHKRNVIKHVSGTLCWPSIFTRICVVTIWSCAWSYISPHAKTHILPKSRGKSLVVLHRVYNINDCTKLWPLREFYRIFEDTDIYVNITCAHKLFTNHGTKLNVIR